MGGSRVQEVNGRRSNESLPGFSRRASALPLKYISSLFLLFILRPCLSCTGWLITHILAQAGLGLASKGLSRTQKHQKLVCLIHFARSRVEGCGTEGTAHHPISLRARRYHQDSGIVGSAPWAIPGLHGHSDTRQGLRVSGENGGTPIVSPSHEEPWSPLFGYLLNPHVASQPLPQLGTLFLKTATAERGSWNRVPTRL